MVQELSGHAGGVLSLLIVGKQVWSGSADKAIRVWDLQVIILVRSGYLYFILEFSKFARIERT